MKTKSKNIRKNNLKYWIIFVTAISVASIILTIGYLYFLPKDNHFFFSDPKTIYNNNFNSKNYANAKNDYENRYENVEHGFSFTYPCKWGNLLEKRTPDELYAEQGSQIKLEFSNLQEKMQSGGSSNDFSASRGIIFIDIKDSQWTALQITCSRHLLCLNDKTSSSKVISRLVFPDKLPLEQNENNQITIPQFFNSTFYKDAYFDIYNSTISILDFKYYFLEDEKQFLNDFNEIFPDYVKVTKIINTNVSDLETNDALAYNQDIEKMKELIDKNEILLPFDAVTTQNLSDFDSMVSSFKFTN